MHVAVKDAGEAFGKVVGNHDGGVVLAGVYAVHGVALLDEAPPNGVVLLECLDHGVANAHRPHVAKVHGLVLVDYRD